MVDQINYQRTRNNTEKIDLLIFITAYIIDVEEEDRLAGMDKMRFEETREMDKARLTEAEDKADIKKKKESTR